MATGGSETIHVRSLAREETRLLLDLARTTAATLDLTTILDLASDFLVKILDASNCFVMLFDEDNHCLRGAASSHRHRDTFRQIVIPIDDPRSFAARVARTRTIECIEDVRAHPELADPGRVKQFGERALLGLPLTSREQLIGVVVVDDTRRPRAFLDGNRELVEATIGQLALPIANARLHASLRESYGELERTRAEMVKRERLAALGELSAIVAHEVRNPLAVIMNAAATLDRAPGDTGGAETADLLGILREECQRLNRIVTDLLDFARPRDVRLTPEDVPPVVQEALESAASQGEAKGIRIEIDAAPDLPRLPMDRSQLRQALVNVALNAVQAMPGGGLVRCTIARESAGGRGSLRIDLVDEGCGIPRDATSRIFEPFFTTKAKGTGLGLAVVKRIVEEHRGEVAIAANPGRGTTVTMRFAID